MNARAGHHNFLFRDIPKITERDPPRFRRSAPA